MADTPLPEALVERLKARIADPAARSDASWTEANGIELDSMIGVPGMPEGLPEQLKEAFHALAGLGMFGSVQIAAKARATAASAPPELAPLAAPCSEDRLVQAEARLGFALPAALRQLYSQVADGGFGPGEGLYPLEDFVTRGTTVKPAGPLGQGLPERLLPIAGRDDEPIYLDLETGALVRREGEGVDAFGAQAGSLAAWLGDWLDRPMGHGGVGMPGSIKAG